MGEPGTRPARGYSWPPFEPGNSAAKRHGARSPRVLQPIADALVAELAAEAPWTARPAFAAELASWAWAEARCQVLREWIDAHAVLSDESERAAGELARAETRAANARDRLGLNPLALAKLLASFSTAAAALGDDDALEQLKAEGRRIVEARSAALEAGSVPGAARHPAGDGDYSDEGHQGDADGPRSDEHGDQHGYDGEDGRHDPAGGADRPPSPADALRSEPAWHALGLHPRSTP